MASTARDMGPLRHARQFCGLDPGADGGDTRGGMGGMMPTTGFMHKRKGDRARGDGDGRDRIPMATRLGFVGEELELGAGAACVGCAPLGADARAGWVGGSGGRQGRGWESNRIEWDGGVSRSGGLRTATRARWR